MYGSCSISIFHKVEYLIMSRMADSGVKRRIVIVVFDH